MPIDALRLTDMIKYRKINNSITNKNIFGLKLIIKNF